MPLDKKVFPLTTLSSSRKWSILSAAPLASGLNLYYFLILLLVFLGIDTSPAQPRNVVGGLPGDALGLRLITGYQVASRETVTCVVAS